MPRRVAAIITAAGASARMGQPKALLDWGGVPLIEHQVQTLATAGCAPIIVVTGAEPEIGDAVPDIATVIHNPRWEQGRSSSIEAGADALADVDAVLVVGVDQPLRLERVRELLVPEAPLVQPVDAAGKPGHPVVLGTPWKSLTTVSEYPDGLRGLVRSLRDRACFVEATPDIHTDLNTLDDYTRATKKEGENAAI